MSEEAARERIAIVWSPEARADIRAIDREIAIQVLHCIDRYLAVRTGDVKKLKPPLTGFRLRCADYRVFFDQKENNAIQITGVRNRRNAYRRLPASLGIRRLRFLPSDSAPMIRNGDQSYGH
jgi:mRNA-degrading endonuclease RelE of RelBE toxin-antitoxin system